MKIYRYLIAIYITFCISLCMNFEAFADTSTNVNNKISTQDQEVTVSVDKPTNIGTTPEIETEVIIDDEDDTIAHAEFSKDTINALKNNSSNNTQIEILDENVPFSSSVEEDKTTTAVPLDSTPKTDDTNFNIDCLLFICVFSLGSIVLISKLNSKNVI